MKGTILEIQPGPEGRQRALVQLEGEGEPRSVDYWPELLEQWGADRLRAHLIQLAAQQRAAEQPPPAAAPDQAALLGEGEAADPIGG